MSAHDHPGLADAADLAATVAFLQRVLTVHEIASCHFDLGSPDIVYAPLVGGTAAFLREIGLRGILEVDLGLFLIMLIPIADDRLEDGLGGLPRRLSCRFRVRLPS
jgi:hypothetical protein